MKMKLTTLLFGLLLAVGWTSSAYAQSSPNNNPDAVHPRSYYEALTYKWTDANNVEHESAATDLATDPYQIYELLRFVYGNPRFPGPRYAGYNYNGTVREDPVSYAPIPGGWNITAANNPRDIKVTVTNYSSYYPVYLRSIQVKSGDKVLDSWTYNSIVNRFLPTNWFVTSGLLTLDEWSNYNTAVNFDGNSGSFTIPAGLLEDYTNVSVVINTYVDYSNARGTISINGSSKTISSTSTSNTQTWNITLPAKTEIPFVQGTVETPYEEGYTALMVSVKNEADSATDNTIYEYGSYYPNKTGYVNYIDKRIKSVQLLTDGLRIGDEAEHTSGTVFNCSGTYNKFYIISKGQAREKADRIKYNFSYASTNNWFVGEDVVHQQMFEQFSPTVTDKGVEINDFYNEMMSGHVYSVKHDCATVIQEKHQFSMSGNNGTKEYAMSGLNFFIPDYRLMFWPSTYNRRNVDGRDIIPYQTANAQGKTNTTFNTNSYWNAWWGNYNPDYAPKIGIYKISLEATAKKSADYDANDETKRNYDVTLNWVSSLNEMTGDMVPQTYEIYKISYIAVMDTTIDEQGNTVIKPTGEIKEVQEYLTTVKDETSYTYQVPQEDESYTITYIIKGYPTPGEGETPSFVAWSNVDDVIIPGLTDFLALILDHYESDFVIGDNLGEEKNYYRNFLHVASDDEGEKALTTNRINAGENEFTLWRYNMATPDNQEKVGVLTFTDRHDGKRVGYGFTFAPNQEVEDYHLQKPAVYNDNHELVKPAVDIDNAYSYANLGMPMNSAGSDLRIKGNGDVIIQPNGYAVNFKEISVYSGSNTNGNRVAHWQVSDGDLPSDWIVSPGSRWVRDFNTDYYYLEGGGYIAIPELMNANDVLTVVINGFGDAGNITYIAVNDHSQNVKNATDNKQNAENYTWKVDSKKYKYVKVTSTSDITNGEYLIVCETKGVAFNGNAGTLDAASNNINVTILDPQSASASIASSSLVDNATFTIDATAGTIKSNSGYYIGWTATSSNGLRQNATEQIRNDISFDGNVAHIKTYGLSTTRELLFNNDKGQKRFRYYPEGSQEPIQLYKKVIDTDAQTAVANVVRLGALPIIDQFAVNVSKNDHPARYAYVLKYEPKAGAEGEAAKAKSSSVVEVPVHHTASVADGFYTETEVKNDTVRKLELNVMSADLQMNLSATNSAAYYYSVLSSNTVMPKIDTDSTYFVSNLQNDNFVYQEMFTKNDQRGHRYNAGEHHFYDSIPAVGTYGSSYKTYVPFITSRAEERYYFADDSLHNTYGSPVWATAVGKVANLSADAQPQQGWNTTWKVKVGEEEETCRLYMLDQVKADGYLPSTDVTNIEYEPYMFRIFVESENGKLRHFQTVTDENGNDVIAAKEGSTTGPWCVWSEYIEFDEDGNIKQDPNNGVEFTTSNNGVITFKKNKVDRPGGSNNGSNNQPWNQDDNNAIFGAVDALASEGATIDAKNLTVYVRFYYRSTGKPIEAGRFMLRADGEKETPMFHASEGAAQAKQTPTAVSEIRYHGEVVSTTYYNIQGMESDKPFDGVNIVVTRYSDGATSISKVVR